MATVYQKSSSHEIVDFKFKLWVFSLLFLFLISITLAHLYFYGPGYATITITGTLYIIFWITLSPLAIQMLFRPKTADWRLLGTLFALMLATGPSFYALDWVYIHTGFWLGIFLIALIFVPTEVKSILIHTKIKSLSSKDPEGLVQALGSSDIEIRKAAKENLILLGLEAIPCLISSYKSIGATDEELSSDIMDALVKIASPIEYPPESNSLQELSVFFKDFIIKPRILKHVTMVTNGIERLQDVSSIPILISVLKSEQRSPQNPIHYVIGDSCFQTLAAFTNLLSTKPLIQSSSPAIPTPLELTELLVQRYAAYPSNKRIEALRSLGHLLTTCITNILSNKQNSPNLKRDLTKLLGSIPDTSVIPHLIDLTTDKLPEIRLLATKHLINFSPNGSMIDSGKVQLTPQNKQLLVDSFVRITHDLEPRIKELAYEGLSRFSDTPHILPLIIDYLSSPSAPGEPLGLRGHIASSAAKSKNPIVLEALFNMLKSGSILNISGAARGLGYFKDPRVLPKLKTLVSHPERIVSVSSAIGLAHQGDFTVKQRLINALRQDIRSPLGSIRSDILEALFQLKDITIIYDLADGISGKLIGWSVKEKIMAIQHLIDLKAPEGFSALEALWNGSEIDPQIRTALKDRLVAAGLMDANTEPPPAKAK